LEMCATTMDYETLAKAENVAIPHTKWRRSWKPRKLNDHYYNAIAAGGISANAIKKAVIMGGDRADMAVTALETDTSCLILTGNLFPPAQVLSLADEKNVPVILVPYDTYTTVEKLNEFKMYAHLEPEKIETWKKLIEENINWKEILEATKKSKR